MENDGFSSGTDLMGREPSREPRKPKPVLVDTMSLPPPPLDETTLSSSSSSSSLRLPSEEVSDDSSGFLDLLKNPHFVSLAGKVTHHHAAADDVFTSQPIPDIPSPSPIYVFDGGFTTNEREFLSF